MESFSFLDFSHFALLPGIASRDARKSAHQQLVLRACFNTDRTKDIHEREAGERERISEKYPQREGKSKCSAIDEKRGRDSDRRYRTGMEGVSDLVQTGSPGDSSL